MRLQEVGDTRPWPSKGVLAGGPLDPIPLDEKHPMPRAGERQGCREPRGPTAQHCHPEGLHWPTIPTRGRLETSARALAP